MSCKKTEHGVPRPTPPLLSGRRVRTEAIAALHIALLVLFHPAGMAASALLADLLTPGGRELLPALASVRWFLTAAARRSGVHACHALSSFACSPDGPVAGSRQAVARCSPPYHHLAVACVPCPCS